MNKFTTTKITVPINHIVPNRWNPNVQSKEMFAKGVNSVKELGMLGSILVRETGGVYEILDGEHRWRYMQELGYTECPVETMGEVSDEMAQTLTILMNNIRGKDDVEKRAKIFEALNEGQLQLLPFTQEEIENEKALFHFDFSKFSDKKEVKERVVNRTFAIALTDDEWEVLQKCLETARNDYKQKDIEWLMEVCKDYLDVRIGTKWRITEEVDNDF